MSNFEYGPSISVAHINGIYSRDISVEGPAKEAMERDYYKKKPLETPKVDDQVVQISNSPAPNPFSSPVYASSSADINSVGQVPAGQEVAPGISEIASAPASATQAVQFQSVGNLENPADLMVNANQDQAVDMNQNGGMQQMNNVTPISGAVTEPILDGNVQGSVTPMENTNQVNDLISQLGPDATVDEAVQACMQMTTAAINNLISFIGRKKSAELDQREALLNQKEAQLQATEQGIQYRLTAANGAFNQPQPIPQMAPQPMDPMVAQQPMMPQDPMMGQGNMGMGAIPQQQMNPMGMQQPVNPMPQPQPMPQMAPANGMQSMDPMATQQIVMPQDPMAMTYGKVA